MQYKEEINTLLLKIINFIHNEGIRYGDIYSEALDDLWEYSPEETIPFNYYPEALTMLDDAIYNIEDDHSHMIDATSTLLELIRMYIKKDDWTLDDLREWFAFLKKHHVRIRFPVEEEEVA